MRGDYKTHFAAPGDPRYTWCGLEVKQRHGTLPLVRKWPNMATCRNCCTIYYQRAQVAKVKLRRAA